MPEDDDEAEVPVPVLKLRDVLEKEEADEEPVESGTVPVP